MVNFHAEARRRGKEQGWFAQRREGAKAYRSAAGNSVHSPAPHTRQKKDKAAVPRAQLLRAFAPLRELARSVSLRVSAPPRALISLARQAA